MLAASALVFALGTWRGISWLEMLSTSAALAVAAVPEGLLVSVTVILTVGMRRMLKRQALVRRLVAAETLGGVNILCVDKTGTLTTGDMTVAELRAGTVLLDATRPNAAGLALLADLRAVNSAHVELVTGSEPVITGSMTEVGIMKYLLTHETRALKTEAQIVAEIPFDSSKKFSAKLLRESGQERALVMGAPDVLLAKCDLDDQSLRAFHAVLADMTARGLRVLLLPTRS